LYQFIEELFDKMTKRNTKKQKLTKKTVTESVTEPVTEPVASPVTESVPEQMTESVPESVPEPVSESVIHIKDPKDPETTQEDLEQQVDQIMKEVEEEILAIASENPSSSDPKETTIPKEKCKKCKPFFFDDDIKSVFRKDFVNPEWIASDMFKLHPKSMWDVTLANGEPLHIHSDHYEWTVYDTETKVKSHELFVPHNFVCSGCDDIHPGIKCTFSSSKVVDK